MVAKRNANSHGLRSAAPVVPGERAEDWDAHRAGMLAALVPVGTLETDLAERVAALTWRLRRVTTYETNVTVAGVADAAAAARGGDDLAEPVYAHAFSIDPPPRTHDKVRKELDRERVMATASARTCDLFRRVEADPPGDAVGGEDAVDLLVRATEYAFPDDLLDEDEDDDEDFYEQLGVPAEFVDEPEAWAGWTLALVAAGIARLAADAELTPAALLARCIRRSGGEAEAGFQKAAELEKELAALTRVRNAAVRSARATAVLPDTAALDRIMRYETHLNKQLSQTLHLLERLQLARAGTPAAPPLALDVTVDAETLAG